MLVEDHKKLTVEYKRLKTKLDTLNGKRTVPSIRKQAGWLKLSD